VRQEEKRSLKYMYDEKAKTRRNERQMKGKP